MDKNTILAIALSAVLLITGFVLIQVLYPAQEQPVQEIAEQPVQVQPDTQETFSEPVQLLPLQESMQVEEEDIIEIETIKAQTAFFEIEFTNAGAAVKSIKLKEHQNSETGEPLELIFNGETGETAFHVKFANNFNQGLEDVFHIGNFIKDSHGFIKSIEFYKDYRDLDGSLFTLTKTYVFAADEYMFEINIHLKKKENFSTAINLSGDYTYKLLYGPQIGPEFESLKERYGEYRKYYIFAGGKRENVKFDKESNSAEIEKRITWGAIAGKYFTLIGVPGSISGGELSTVFTQEYSEDPSLTSTMAFQRASINSADVNDKYNFYFGPKLSSELKRYKISEDNAFGLSGISVEKVVDTGGIFSIFEWLVHKGLIMFYALIPNFGIAIILVTLLIKLLLYPLTRKSLHSTSKMQALSPQLNELKEKYKSNPQKLNSEMATLYKKEGVNPLGGCLPLLLQFPFLIGFYQLLTKQFELRGAGFFGWITDLSMPESIVNFGSFTVPLIGMNDIRVLPILYVGTQLLSSWLNQAGQGPSAAPASKNMKLMQYGLPIVFFFVLYNAPSGLLLYWTITNLVTGIQQYIMQRRMKKKMAG